MPNDDIEHIPAITATRDNDSQRSRVKPRKSQPGSKGSNQTRSSRPASSKGGSGILARLFITVSLVVAAIACAWAWQLQEELRQSSTLLAQYDQRISDLEDRLSDTDEGMNQNATLQAAKIRELDKEVRKLWDNVWKKASKRLDTLEKNSTANAKKIASTTKSLSSEQAQLKGLSADIAKLKSVAGDLERLMASARTNQAEVERVADSLNRMNLEFTKLGKRVQSNEEWVGSVNAFRRQVNTTMGKLQTSVRALEARP
jgi:chromosome segregation ATPase